MASAFGADDGGEQLGVDVVLGAGFGKQLAQFGGSGLRGYQGWLRFRCWCGNDWCRRVRQGLDANHGSSGDVHVVLLGCAEIEADFVADNLATDAVELEAVGEGDVLDGAGHGGAGCERGEGEDDFGARNHGQGKRIRVVGQDRFGRVSVGQK